MRILFILFFVLVTNAMAFADGNIAGKISDEKTGEPVIGATVMVKGTGKGTATDVDGRFQITIAAGDYSVEVRYLGYQPKDISDVVVKDGQTTTVDAVITEDSKTQLKDVVVTATLKRESVNALYVMQRNSVAVSSGISADVIQRTPDRNTGEVLKRVSGASVKDNKYVVIRGLSDRYNLAMVNNALMPSTEPDKKAFSFDVIPSNLIDNIIINKTASPDMPGDFAGGIVQVLTKGVPDRNFLNAGVGQGYNTQSTFEHVTVNKRAAGDYIGFPSGAGLPSAFGDNYREYKQMPSSAQVAATKALQNNYPEIKSANLPNTALQASLGNVQYLENGAKFGTIVGLSYRNSQTIIPDYIRGKYEQGEGRVSSYVIDQQNRFSSNLAGLANFSYVAGRSKFSFKNLYNKAYDNYYYTRNGHNTSNNQQIKMHSFVPSERQLYNTQLEGDHAIGARNIKVTWNLNYANLNTQQNDLRTAFYSRSASFDANDEPVVDEVQPFRIVDRNSRRFFSNQTDNNFGGNLTVSYPFEMFGLKQTFKTGYLGSYRTRTFGARTFQYEANDMSLDHDIEIMDVNTIFSDANIGGDGFRLNEITSPDDSYDATGLLNAGFVVLDNKLSDKWRAVWGVRIESYAQTLGALNRSGAAIDQTDVFNDVLPSLNISYDMNEKSKIRFGGSRTVNRPEFREIAPFQFIDFENLWTIAGNPALKRANINNFDLRYEFYPNPGEVITLGAFYKRFENPIEAKMNDQSNLDLFIFDYQNASSADAVGAELDIRKNMSFISPAKWAENLTLAGNFTYIYSKVDASFIGTINIPGTKTNRPLQGQSPYLVNVSALYNDPNSGWAFSALYNRIGHRIAIVGNGSIPTTWENGRDIVDLQISKQVLKKKGEVKLTVGDLLNSPTTYYWNTDTKDSYQAGASKVGNGNDQIFHQFKQGTTLSLGFNYRFGK